MFDDKSKYHFAIILQNFCLPATTDGDGA